MVPEEVEPQGVMIVRKERIKISRNVAVSLYCSISLTIINSSSMDRYLVAARQSRLSSPSAALRKRSNFSIPFKFECAENGEQTIFTIRMMGYLHGFLTLRRKKMGRWFGNGELFWCLPEHTDRLTDRLRQAFFSTRNVELTLYNFRQFFSR